MLSTRWTMFSCAALLALTGCERSQVDPTEAITLSGTVLREDKRPLAEAMLRMDRSDNSACVFSAFHPNWKAMMTDGEGHFRQELLGADTRNGSVARCFYLYTPPREGGGRVSVSFLIQEAQVQVPTLQQWGGSLAAVATDGGVRLTFSELSTSHGVSGLEYALSLRRGSTHPIWQQAKVSSPVQLSDAVLEDFTDLKASLATSRRVTGNATSFDIHYVSDTVGLPTRARVPASRGATCEYTGVGEGPCPLTDGAGDNVVLFASGVQQLTLRLPSAKVLRKAVLRNLQVTGTATEVVLEGSGDGSTWAPLASLLDGERRVPAFSEVALAEHGAMSQVRLRGTAESGSTFALSSLSELSLFE